MCDPFVVNFDGDAATLISKARKAIEDKDGTFNGDENSGRVSVKSVDANYVIRGSEITVSITDKPFLFPCSAIESRIREFFRG